MIKKRNIPSYYKCPKCKKRRMVRIENGFEEKYVCENCKYIFNPNKLVKISVEGIRREGRIIRE